MFVMRDKRCYGLIARSVLFEDQHRVQNGNDSIDEIIRQPIGVVRRLREKIVDQLDQFSTIAFVGRSGFA